MLKAAAGGSLEGAVILGLAAGLRIAEAVVVRWGDVEEDGTLTIRRSAWGETKSGKVRSLTLPPSAHQALKRIKREQAEKLLAVGIRQSSNTTIVADAVGRPLPLATFKKAFREFRRRQGFAVSFHALRHSNAIAMLMAGVDVKTASARLGHASPALLLSTCSHFIRAADKEAAGKLDGMLGG